MKPSLIFRLIYHRNQAALNISVLQLSPYLPPGGRGYMGHPLHYRVIFSPILYCYSFPDSDWSRFFISWFDTIHPQIFLDCRGYILYQEDLSLYSLFLFVALWFSLSITQFQFNFFLFPPYLSVCLLPFLSPFFASPASREKLLPHPLAGRSFCLTR